MSSWVKVSRKLLTSAIASKPEYLAVWLHLLLSANYKEGDFVAGRQIVRLKPGDLIFGRHKFSEKTGVSESIIRGALKALENLQQITIKSYSKFSVISITNWARYQVDDQQMTSRSPAVDQQMTTSKEGKEIQEEDINQKPLSSGNDDPPKTRTRKADETPYQNFMETYQQICGGRFKPAEKLNPKRKIAIKRAWDYSVRNTHPFRNDGFLEKYLGKCILDKFMCGENARGWKADIEYVFREKTINDQIGV